MITIKENLGKPSLNNLIELTKEKKQTEPQFKQIENFKPSVQMIKAGQEVFLYMANVETIKPNVQNIQNSILEKHKFKTKKTKEEKQTIVLKNNESYLLKDSDFKVYLNECRKEYLKIKLIDENFNKDFCPLLVAEDKLRKAENKFIKICCEEVKDLINITPEQLSRSLKHRKNFIELNLRFISQFIK